MLSKGGILGVVIGTIDGVGIKSGELFDDPFELKLDDSPSDVDFESELEMGGSTGVIFNIDWGTVVDEGKSGGKLKNSCLNKCFIKAGL